VRRDGRCPLTGMPMGDADLIRIFEASLLQEEETEE
jgi:hypothetical protein